MNQPLRDVVVVLPGIMGSELRDSDGDVVWGTSKGSLVKAVLTGGKAIKRLQLPDGIGDEPAPDGIVATRLLPDIHVIPGIWSVPIGYDHMLQWFRDHFAVVEAGGSGPGAVNFVPFAYDWRLWNRASAAALKQTVEPVLERFRAQPGCSDAKLVLVGHSMGGLVARYYVDVLGGHEVTRKVITLGTPHRGAVNALESLVNGVAKGFGPLRIDLTSLARSMPALFQLLPEYACIESANGLLKTTEVSLPDLSAATVADAMRFHEELRSAASVHADAFDAHPILARTQPTSSTARLVDGRVEVLRTFEGRDEGGDGTVPRLSATPYGVTPDSATVRYVKDKHGALPANDPLLIELEGVLTATDVIARDSGYDLGVTCDDVVFVEETLAATIEVESDLVVDVQLAGADGSTVVTTMATDRGDDTYLATFDGLAPGRYSLRVGVRGAGETVTTPIVVLAPIEVE